MSKSLGNSLIVSEVLKRTRPIALRYYLGAAHYRSNIEYHEGSLREAEATVERIETFLRRAASGPRDLRRDRPGECPRRSPRRWTTTSTCSGALAVVHDTVRAGNTALDEDDDEAVRGGLRRAVVKMTDVLGINPLDPHWAGASATDTRALDALGALVEAELEERQAARARRDFVAADGDSGPAHRGRDRDRRHRGGCPMGARPALGRRAPAPAAGAADARKLPAPRRRSARPGRRRARSSAPAGRSPNACRARVRRRRPLSGPSIRRRARRPRRQAPERLGPVRRQGRLSANGGKGNRAATQRVGLRAQLGRRGAARRHPGHDDVRREPDRHRRPGARGAESRCGAGTSADRGAAGRAGPAQRRRRAPGARRSRCRPYEYAHPDDLLAAARGPASRR